MGSMIDSITGGNRAEGNRDPMALTKTQTDLLKEAGLKPGTKEWKDQELKMKIGNLSNAVSLANELGEAFKAMRKTAVDGMGR